MESSSGMMSENGTSLAFTLLESSIESLQDILIFSIDKNYRYLNYNTAFKEATMRAYGTEVVKGASMLDTITDEKERVKARQNSDKALRGESHTTVEVYGNLNPSYFETRYCPIRNEKSEIIGVTILSTDITEKKQAEEQIRTLNKELEAFSYSVAHDLRAPLRIINGYSGVLMEDHLQTLNAECQDILKIISGNVKKMGRLIEGLLEFSKLGKLPVTKAAIDMDTLIKAVLEEQLTLIQSPKPRITLGRLENLNGDRNLISHVFTNLISNAIKYSSKRENPEIEINSFRDDQCVTYSIKDNGVGFNMEYVEKLFQVFQRLHSELEFAGTGVGLAIAQRIVVKHGGRIWAESEVNKGATFFISLPV
jgi:PAS domain S-box-containing protein